MVIAGKYWYVAENVGSVIERVKFAGCEDIAPNGIEVEYFRFENDEGELLVLKKEKIELLKKGE